MTDSWATPGWILDLFPGFFDPCPLHCPDHLLDDLLGTWDPWTYPGIFINPPYSDVTPWIEKAIRTREITEIPIVMLLNHDCSTKWFARLHEHGARILMFSGRLRFGDAKSNPRPSMLVIM